MVTHQVYEIDPAAQMIGTQGIANKNADGSIMHDAEQTPFSSVIGTVSFCVPYLGFVNAYCTTMPGLLVVVAVLALLAAASIVSIGWFPTSLRASIPACMRGSGVHSGREKRRRR